MSTPGQLLLCTCAGSQRVDPVSAGEATGAPVRVCERLCTTEIATAERALTEEGVTLIACEQQAEQFADLAQELGASAPITVDIRDRAGWTSDKDASAKQAALLALALIERPATPVKSVISEGVCLILGEEAALEAARELASDLSVTCLLTGPSEDLVPTDAFDVARGTVRSAAGALGAFSLSVDGYAPLEPAGRGAATFAPAVDGAQSQCDIIVDLRGGPALFPAPHKREGYLRADPREPGAVARLVREAAGLIGEFEKPLYVRFDASICAHSRASQTGCSRCLDVCPTGAITSAGDTVAIDPLICAGCGACAAVCPSGAASYDDPAPDHLFKVLSTLADAYRNAGGKRPRVVFHDAAYGGQMIELGARFGRGLPADVIPVEVQNVEGVGHAELLAALGVGFQSAAVLMGDKTDRTVPERELVLARSILEGTGVAGEAVSLIDVPDPDALADRLFDAAPLEVIAEPILPLGDRRQVTRLAATALAGGDVPAPIALPEGAPYGAIALDKDACTLCLACVSLCPVGALGDNPDKPMVRFQETACVQCGICESTCPENAITLDPRLDLGQGAMVSQPLNEEEPFECISCGAPFGVKATIERVVEKLQDKHWMFKDSDNVKLIQMCDDCRVNAQYHSKNSPLRMGERPRVRTTEDELAANKNRH